MSLFDSSPLDPAPLPARVIRRFVFRWMHRWRPPHRVKVRVGTVHFEVSSKSRLAEEVFANAFERREREILRRLVAPGDIVLDIGANIGFYTCLFAAAVGPNGRVMAFEPTPATREQLVRNISLNQFANVDVYEVALSDREGRASFNVFPEGSDAYNSLQATSTWGESHAEVVTVSTDRLDRFVGRLDHRRVSVVKIDVEGAEELVIGGGRDFLSALDSTVLMLELNNAAAQQFGSSIYRLVDELKARDYRGFLLDGKGSLAPIDADGLRLLASMQARHFDAFFARPGGVNKLVAQGLL